MYQSELVVQGMVFNLVIGVKDLERLNETDEKKKKYAIILADTVHPSQYATH